MKPKPWVRRAAWTAVVLVFGAVFAVGVWSMREETPPKSSGPLPILRFEPVPPFRLMDPSGRMVGREDLLGTVWLAGFVFTRCTGPCPELTLRMRSIQQGLADRGLSARLVTFTLDPEHDTPAVLAAYARRFHADPDRWWFLTGNDQPSTHRLIREGFLQTVVPAAAGEPLTHSTYFVLLDHQARIRAVYDGLDPQSKLRILGDVEALLQESPAS